MAGAYDLYKLQNTPDQPTASSIYTDIPSPFKKVDSGLPAALASFSRKLLTSSPQQKLKDPVDTTLSDVRASENIPVMAQDNTRIDTENSLPKFLDIVKSPVSPFKKQAGFDPIKFQTDTIGTESGGNAKATNPHSSAQGKYQFLWSDWGDSIRKVTGIKSPEEFRNNPEAQDKFFKFYTNSTILPEVNKLRPLAERYDLSDNDLARLVHFRGAGGAHKALAENLLDKKLEGYNMTINQYLGRKKQK